MLKQAICFTLMLFHTPQALSGDCWVAPNGSDANPGSKEQPYRTVQKAADVLHPGDTCTVRGGKYREAVTIRRSNSGMRKPARNCGR